MITNHRQYRITKARLQDFERAIAEINSTQGEAGPAAELVDLQREALASQHEELAAEIEEYERLRSGEQVSIEATLADFPRALIAARVARGLTQKELGEQLGVKEQQVQRWESTRYANTTFNKLQDVVGALGLQVREEIFLPTRRLTIKTLIKSLKKIGLRSELLLKRLLPPEVLSASPTEDTALVFHAANVIARVFGLSASSILGDDAPNLDLHALAAGRFKVPASAGEEAVSAYTLYAHYLATLVERCVRHLPVQKLPSTWQEAHSAIVGSQNETVSFERALDYVWSVGIPVLPLQDPGAFHGAVWIINGRPIIVLKQGAKFASRWLFDLLHELDHVLKHADNGVSSDFYVIEVHPISPERRESSEEIEASEFAENVLFHGRSSEIEKVCATAANGNIRNLKHIVPQVAMDHHIDVGVLANHMAFRLAQQGETWWPTAMVLQQSSIDPFAVARDRLLMELRLKSLLAVDRDLLLRACSNVPSPEESQNG
jgi:transcriptional regulator with XRE-family HTH domain/Zn-dependent peptidase ImmA (M78 family)